MIYLDLMWYSKCSKISNTIVVCHKGFNKQHRPRSDWFWRRGLIRVFPVCYSDKLFVNSSPNKQQTSRSDWFWRRGLIRVFPVCYSDKHFVNFSPANQYFNWKQKEKSVQNFRTFTVRVNEPWHEISNNVVCVTSKGSDQPVHTGSLIKAFASSLNIRWILSYWPNNIWSF